MAAQNNMHNLTTLIKRLEAATSRLEDIATSVDGTAPNGLSSTSSHPLPIAAAAESATTLTPVPESKPDEPLPKTIEEYDEFLSSDVQAFVDASAKIGGLVEEQAKAVQDAFKSERTFLLVTTKAKKPDQLPNELMEDIHRHISRIDEIKETNPTSKEATHLKAVSEGIMAMGWIAQDRPIACIDDGLSGSQYWGNRILKEYREKDENHVKYIQAYYKLFRSLSTYVKEHYKAGVTWNNKDGIDAAEAFQQVQSSASTPKPSAGGTGPPPPPPLPPADFNRNGPPPPPPPPGAPSSSASKGGDMTAVFDQLNQGASVTSGLRKVDQSQMTHKNPSLRAGAAVPQRTASQTSVTSAGRGKSPLPAKKPDSLKSKKPGKKELDGNKWLIENFDNTGSEIIEVSAELSHSILITKCSKCIIKINGKANAISIDNSPNVSILVGSLVSSLDVIKSNKFAVQIDGQLPTIMLDQVDGAQIYLGEDSMSSPPEIYTSKCSSINIVLPPKDDEDDSTEAPLPEQLRSYFKDGKLVTEVVEHAG